MVDYSVAKTLICAAVLGVAFESLRLDIPAPPTIQGIVGIVGLFIGYKIGGLL
jgi:XapX domain-containing protein